MGSASLIEKCCLIANPVAGNPTHYIIEQAFTHRGLDWRFMTFEVDQPSLGDAVRGIRALGFRGVKIAEPYHESVIEFLDEVTPRAKRCGSVNCITAEGHRLTGDNTEGVALIDLVRQFVNPTGVTAVLIGTGRVARAIAVAMTEAGVASVHVLGRSEARGRQLVELIQGQSPTTASFTLLANVPLEVSPEAAIVVNATSLGAHDPSAKLPVVVDSLNSKLVVADVAFNASHTWLTRQAAERSCRVIEGVELFVEQTAAAIRAWTGDSPDTNAMREAAEEYLGI